MVHYSESCEMNEETDKQITLYENNLVSLSAALMEFCELSIDELINKIRFEPTKFPVRDLTSTNQSKYVPIDRLKELLCDAEEKKCEPFSWKRFYGNKIKAFIDKFSFIFKMLIIFSIILMVVSGALKYFQIISTSTNSAINIVLIIFVSYMSYLLKICKKISSMFSPASALNLLFGLWNNISNLF